MTAYLLVSGLATQDFSLCHDHIVYIGRDEQYPPVLDGIFYKFIAFLLIDSIIPLAIVSE